MITLWTITNLGKLYSSTGIDIKNPTIVKKNKRYERQFKVWSRKIISSNIDYTKSQLRNLIFILFALVSIINWAVHSFLQKNNSYYQAILLEGGILFYLLVFGFKEYEVFISDTKKLIIYIFKLYIKITIAINVIIVLLSLSLNNTIIGEPFIKINSLMFAFFSLSNLALFLFYRGIPFFLSELMAVYFKKLIRKCYKLDKPLSQFFRYISLITGFITSIQFVITYALS